MVLAQRQLRLPDPDLGSFNQEPLSTWFEWLHKAEEELKGRKLFFTFDEFEKLVEAAEKNQNLIAAFDIFRHLSQHWPKVYLLFAGAHRPQEIAPRGLWHDYFISTKLLEISYLAEADARYLLTNPVTDFQVNYTPEALAKIIQLTHCQPYLIQLTGRMLIDRLNSQKSRKDGNWSNITLNDVELVSNEIPSRGRPYFASLWEDSSKQGKQILRALATSVEGLDEKVLEKQSGLSGTELPSILTQLQEYQLVEQDIKGLWRIQVELTRRAFAHFSRDDN